MRAKPRYHLLDNSRYALAGVRDMLCHEKSFRLEIVVIALLQAGLLLADFPFVCLAILRLSLLLPLLAEAVNSAIERTVDLVTAEYDPVAKQAKDLGSAVVLLTIVWTTSVWACTLYYVLAVKY